MSTSPRSHEHDVIVIGTGHNSLTCAGYLAQAGLDVLVLEGRDVAGGSTATEELTLPGWQHDSSSSAHVDIQYNPLIAHDELGLISEHGLKYFITDPAFVMPLDGRDSFVLHSNLEASAQEFARFSTHDRSALVDMMNEWDSGLRVAHAHFQAGLAITDTDLARRYEELRRRSAWDVVHETFEHAVVRRAMAWLSFATLQPPRRSGTGALPAAILSGRLRYGWTTPMGGSRALPDAQIRHLRSRGGDVVTNAWVNHLLVDDSGCHGVRTHDGRTFFARRAVVSGAHVVTLNKMLNGASRTVAEASQHWRPGLSLFAVHVALTEHPRYALSQGLTEAVAGALGSPEGLDRQVNAALEGRADLSDPWLLLVDSTVVDPQRAPGAALKILTIAPELDHGQPWSDDATSHYAARLLDVAREKVTGLNDENILAMRAESPTSMSRRDFAGLAGSCYGGEFLLDDGSYEPGWREVSTDVDGLFLTGSTTHPGGSVSGQPGRNSARVVLEHLGLAPSSVMSTP